MKFIRTLYAFCLALFLANATSFAQQIQNPIDYSLPYLSLTSDARAAGMGNVGIATDPSANAAFWNPGKIVFNKPKIGASLSHTPWFREIVDDMHLTSLAGYYKLNNKQALGISSRLFNYGTLMLSPSPWSMHIKDFAVSISYSHKLNQHLGIGISGRFAHTNVEGGGTFGGKSSNTAMADIGVFYSKPIKIGGKEMQWNLGAGINNFGPKAYHIHPDNRNFVPTILRTGSALSTNFGQEHTLAWAVEMSKYMVPTPPVTDHNGNIIQGSKVSDKSFFEGTFGSFTDAPGGLTEELNEIMWSTGLEYTYGGIFSVRTGYHYEHENKGDKSNVTVGVGIDLCMFNFNGSYVFSTQTSGKLAERFRASVGFSL